MHLQSVFGVAYSRLLSSSHYKSPGGVGYSQEAVGYRKGFPQQVLSLLVGKNVGIGRMRLQGEGGMLVRGLRSVSETKSLQGVSEEHNEGRNKQYPITEKPSLLNLLESSTQREGRWLQTPSSVLNLEQRCICIRVTACSILSQRYIMMVK